MTTKYKIIETHDFEKWNAKLNRWAQLKDGFYVNDFYELIIENITVYKTDVNKKYSCGSNINDINYAMIKYLGEYCPQLVYYSEGDTWIEPYTDVKEQYVNLLQIRFHSLKDICLFVATKPEHSYGTAHIKIKDIPSKILFNIIKVTTARTFVHMENKIGLILLTNPQRTIILGGIG